MLRIVNTNGTMADQNVLLCQYRLLYSYLIEMACVFRDIVVSDAALLFFMCGCVSAVHANRMLSPAMNATAAWREAGGGEHN